MRLHAGASPALVQRHHSRRCTPFGGANTRRPAAQPAHAAHATSATARVVVARAGLDLDALGLDVPDIDGDLKSVQTELGATFDAAGVAQSYGNSRQAVEAVGSGVCLVDRSHWPRIRLTGRDRIPVLQRFTTQDFSNLTPGQGCDTVLVDAHGNALDLVTATVADSYVLLVVSPGAAESAVSLLKAAAAEAEMKVQVQDVSQRTVLLTLVGPESENVLKELAGEALVSAMGSSYGSHTLLKFRGTPVLITVGCGLPVLGYSLVADETVSGELYSVFAAKGCILMGQEEWDCARTLAGRPALGSEMGPGVGCTPLEAGLYHAVNLGKTLGSAGVQALAAAEAAGKGSQLWGLELEVAAEPGASVAVEGGLSGRVTSSTTTPTGQNFALAFIGTESGAKPAISAGMPATVGGSPATVASIAFASRQFLSDLLGSSGVVQSGAVAGPGAELMAAQAEEQRRKRAEEEAEAQAARLQRIKENAERLAAWQAKQLGASGTQ